jgi:mannose-6-phosphate isomerase-like protein (cupin superfamily)
LPPTAAWADTKRARSREKSDRKELEVEATVHRPGEGERIGGPTTVTIKATGDDTNDSFYLGDVVTEPGFAGPPPHVHERVHDMFYVLEGTLTMRLNDQTTALPAGSFVCVPPGVVHTFSNPGDAPVRFLNFNTPAGWENYMRDLAALLNKGTPSQKEIGEVASRYDFQVT